MRTNSPCLWRLSLLLGLLLSSASTRADDLYVAADGNDSWSGTVAEPNPEQSDGPFRTIERARDAVRQLKSAQGGLKEPVRILLRHGVYQLNDTLQLGPEDSGTADAAISYEAFPGETPVISGGRAIANWRKHDATVWVADVPWAVECEEGFTQLFVDGQRRVRARTPDHGKYFYTKRLQLTTSRTPICLGLTFFEEDIQPWDGLTETGRVVLFHNWVNSYNCVADIDWPRQRIVFARPAGAYFLGQSIRYYVDNIRAGLDAPGEWFLDKAAGRIYYYPLEGEDLERAEIIAPVVRRTLLSLKGALKKGTGPICLDGPEGASHKLDLSPFSSVEHLAFRGLSFQHCDADLSPDYPHSVQGAHHQTGAVTAVGLRHSLFERCEFAHIGEHAVALLEGCTDNTIRQCHVHDMGGGGIYLSGEHPKQPDERLFTLRNTIENNFIHDGGHLFRAGCGVFLGGSASYNRIVHNDICDMSWMAVHLGWSWSGRQPAYTHHNEVGYNHLHHLGNGVLNDIGGIYTLGVSPGTILHHNHIHDVTRFERGREGYGGWGIYLDAGSSEIRVENNVVHDTRDGGLHLHNHSQPYGDLVVNNVFAYSAGPELMRNANHEPEGNHVHLERNIVYGAGTEMFGGNNWHEASKFTSDKNCFFSEAGPPDFFGKRFERWQATGRDTNSIVADPRFVDAARRDFRLQPDSPVLGLGFEPIDMSTVGLQGSASWRDLPQRFQHRTFEAAEPAERWPLREGFEEYDPGEIPAGAVPDEGGTRVRVVAEQASQGRHSMRFDDAPGATAWKPHWCVYFEPRDGNLRLACSVRNDPEYPASFNLEFRDWPAGSTYRTGPYVEFLRDGTLRAPGGDGGWKEIGKLPPGAWARVEIDLCQGDRKGYSLRLILRDGKPVIVENLPLRNADFQRCNWVGFSGTDTKKATFYVDEVTIE